MNVVYNKTSLLVYNKTSLFVYNKINDGLNLVQKKIITTWNFKTTLVWSALSFVFITINLIFFLIAINLRHNKCVNSSFDLPDFLLLVTGSTLGMILASWMINYIGGKGFWLSLVNLGYHLIFTGWLLLSAIGGIILIAFSESDCANKPEAIFIVVPIYLVIHNMIGGVLMSILCGTLLMESIQLYYNRHTLLDDLVV